MTLNQAIRILRARYRVAALTLFTTIAATLALSYALPKQYTASTSVVVDVKSPDPIAGIIFPAVVLPAYMATQIDIINSDRVAQKVVEKLNLAKSAAARDQWKEATGGRGSLE